MRIKITWGLARAQNWEESSESVKFKTSFTQIFSCILLIGNHTVFLVQFGINLHLWVFQKAQSCKLIPNWTRNRMITYTNFCFLPLCACMIWHRSEEHQNVPSNRLFTSSFSFSLSTGLEIVLAQNGNVEDQPWPRVNKCACQTRSLGKHDVTLSGLARPGRWAFVSKWWQPMPASLETNYLG